MRSFVHPKDQGGMGILNLELQNKCFLSKWLYKLFNSVAKQPTKTEVEHVLGDSQFWTVLKHVKNVFLRFVMFQLGDRSQIRFWEDHWIGQHCLKDKFPSLYNIVRRKGAAVTSVRSTTLLNISFRWPLT